MAYTTNYTALRAEVMKFVENDVDEFVAELDNIIGRAIDQVQRDLNLSIWRAIETHHVSANNPKYTRKSAWLKILSVYFPDSGKFAERRTLDWLRMAGTTKGVPRYFAEDEESSIRLVPIPLQNYKVEVEALTKLPNLSATSPTNWITENAADLLLLQCLIGSEAFLVAPERVGEFGAYYAATLSAAKQQLMDVERDDTTPIRAAPIPKVAA